MTFNSFIFLGFFALTYGVYLALSGRHRAQNTALLAASLIFYGYWDWRFLLLLGFSCTIDYGVAIALENEQSPSKRYWLLVVSLVSNLAVLGFFKYFHFFADSLIAVFRLAGWQFAAPAIRVILPVGISFYTFQALSYTIDVYRGHIKAIRYYPDYLLFITFFPHMVAGPIQLSRILIPQVLAPRRIGIERIEAAIPLILWGYFKKVVVADNAALVADRIFNNYGSYAGLDILIAALAFAIQIYGDFSGYSDIARGLSKLMGFELMLNFRRPYFAKSPSDFWARWHISLSTWLKDYLYVPLGGNRGGTWVTYRNLMLTMVLGGLWHGAAWNYVLWGFYHGGLLIAYRALGAGQRVAHWSKRGLGDGASVLLMFFLTLIGWILFRARSAQQVAYMLSHLGLSRSGESLHFLSGLVFFTWPLILVEFAEETRADAAERARSAQWWVRVPAYSLIIIAMALFGVRQSSEFIYFQF